MTPHILLIDNYDSFTYNLMHYLKELGAAVKVVRNNTHTSEQILAMNIHGIVISPGPCDPDKAGVCLDLLQKSVGKQIPIFGVCLGHQAIGQAFGGKVIRAPHPMHGKISHIYHNNTSVFTGLPSPFNATRYHSLIVEQESLPDCLEITAKTEDGLIMGLSHKTYPIHGVQFHPESIASEHGHAMLKNFLTYSFSHE
jgi:anthranilate synthase component II